MLKTCPEGRPMTRASDNLSLATWFCSASKLLLLRFQLHLRAKLVDGGRRSRAMLIARSFVKRLRRLHLHARGIHAGAVAIICK